MILTVTPNAAVDKTYRVAGFRRNRVNRPETVSTVAGGKGINVARVYRTLGGEAMATGFLGGANGRWIAQALQQEGIRGEFVRTGGESRLCIAIVDPEDGSQTEINEPGPPADSRFGRELLRRVARLLSQTSFDFVVLSGSLPPDCPASLYADLITLARRWNVPAALDAGGEALKSGIDAEPWMVKPNHTEAELLLGFPIRDRDGALRAAKALQSRGVRLVAVTCGASGAVALYENAAWWAVPPEITFASAVASGDAFLAAFLWEWTYGSRRGDLARSLSLATGAGAANAAVVGAGFCSRESILTMAENTQSELLTPEV